MVLQLNELNVVFFRVLLKLYILHFELYIQADTDNIELKVRGVKP